MALSISRTGDSLAYVVTGAQNAGDTYIGAGDAYIHLRPSLTFDGCWAMYGVAISGADGWTADFRLNAANHYGGVYRTDLWMAAWSYDLHGDEWHAFDHVSLAGQVFTFTNDAPFTQGTVYVTAKPCFSYTRMQARIDAWIASPYAASPAGLATPYLLFTTTPRSDNLGRAIGALTVRTFELSDWSVTDPKVTVTLQGGQHPDERHGFWVYEGMVDFLLSGDAVATRLLQTCRFRCVPMCNPQGVWASYVRSSPEAPLIDHNRVWEDAVPAHETVAALKVFHAAHPSQVFIDTHNRDQFSTTSQLYVDTSGGIGGSYYTAVSAHHTTQKVVSVTAGNVRSWLSATIAEYELGATPEEAPNTGKDIAAKRAYGEALLRGLDDLVQAGALVPLTAPSTVVTDLQYRLGTAGAFTALPTQAEGDTSYTLTTAAFAEGTLQVELRARDTSDDATSAWVRRSFTVSHAAVGTFLAINGVTYRVIADEPEVTPAVATTASVRRAFDGTLLTSVLLVGGATALVAARRWSCRIYDLTPVELDTLRAALANRQRVVVTGDLVGGSTVCTGSIESAVARVWRNGTSSLRTRVSLTLESVQ